jgi:FixJ family two-component response regulator
MIRSEYDGCRGNADHGDRGRLSVEVRSGCSTLWDGYGVIASNGCTVVTTPPTLPSGVGGREEPVVLVIDDDMAMRESLASLFQSVGLRVKVFGSAPELLQSRLPNAPSCLVLDIRLPGISGLDFQVEMAKSGIHIPIIFMTGHGDIPMSVQAMKAGAVDFLTKPFRHQEMLHAVTLALDVDRKRRVHEKTVSDLRLLYESLTVREREVLTLVTAGMMNKLIAEELGVSEITVKVHRSHVMRKMRTRSLADLARIADTLGIRRDKPERS